MSRTVFFFSSHFISKIFIQDGRFSIDIYIYIYTKYIYIYIYIYNIYIYIYTKYIKITAFQTSPVEKERKKRLNFTFQ